MAATPLVQTASILVEIVTFIFKILSLYHIRQTWKQPHAITAGLRLATKEFMWIALHQLTAVELELSDLYLLVRPYDGRKPYASLERLHYGDPLRAACFQPDAQHHLIGLCIPFVGEF